MQAGPIEEKVAERCRIEDGIGRGMVEVELGRLFLDEMWSNSLSSLSALEERISFIGSKLTNLTREYNV